MKIGLKLTAIRRNRRTTILDPFIYDVDGTGVLMTTIAGLCPAVLIPFIRISFETNYS